MMLKNSNVDGKGEKPIISGTKNKKYFWTFGTFMMLSASVSAIWSPIIKHCAKFRAMCLD